MLAARDRRVARDTSAAVALAKATALAKAAPPRRWLAVPALLLGVLPGDVFDRILGVLIVEDARAVFVLSAVAREYRAAFFGWTQRLDWSRVGVHCWASATVFSELLVAVSRFPRTRATLPPVAPASTAVVVHFYGTQNPWESAAFANTLERYVHQFLRYGTRLREVAGRVSNLHLAWHAPSTPCRVRDVTARVRTRPTGSDYDDRWKPQLQQALDLRRTDMAFPNLQAITVNAPPPASGEWNNTYVFPDFVRACGRTLMMEHPKFAVLRVL